MIKLWRDQSLTQKLAIKTSKDQEIHERECNKRHVEAARLAQKVDDLRVGQKEVRLALHSIGNATIKIAAKMNVELD